MTVKTLKNIAVVACVAALAVPAAVLANGPSGNHGKSGQPHGKSHSLNSLKPKHVNSRCKTPMVGFVVGGRLDGNATQNSVSFTVTHSNRHARTWFKKGDTYTVTGADLAKVQYKGASPWAPGAELHRSDWKVQVIGKVAKPKKHCTAANSPAPVIRKIMVIGPGAGESGSNTGSNESGENESGSNTGANQS